MEHNKRRSRPSLEELEGRRLLSGSKASSTVHAAAITSTVQFSYTTPQGAKVVLKVAGPGTLAGTTVDPAGNLNLVYSGTTVFTTISGTVKGGSGKAPVASIRPAGVPMGSLTGIGGDLLGRMILPSFDLISGGKVNLLSGVQVFTLDAVASNTEIHLRDTPLNTTLGLPSYVNTVTGSGSSYAKLSSTSTGATTSSASGLSSGTSIGVATGSSAGGVTTIGVGTLGPTAVGFGGGSVGAINGAIPIINTVGNGENFLGTPGLTQTQVNQGRTTTYVVGTNGGTQLSTVAGTFAPGLNLIEPSDVSLPPHRVPPPGVIVTIQHVNGGPTAQALPLGDPQIYGYDAKANALIRFDASTGAALQTIPLPASTSPVGGVSLARNGQELVVLVGIGPNVLAFDATSGTRVGQFAITRAPGTAGFTVVTGVATANGMTVLEDAFDGPTGTIQAIDVAASLARGLAVPSGPSFAPTREFALAGTLTSLPGTGDLFALGSAYFDTTQPNLKQAGILTVTPGTTRLAESARTALVNSATGLDFAAGTDNAIAGSNSTAIGSLNSFLAVDTGVFAGVNLLKLFSPNGLTSEGSFTLNDANPLSDLSQSFHPELTNSALIDVQGNIQSFTARTANGLVLNGAGNFDLLQAQSVSNSTIIGEPFAHVSIARRNNVVIATNSRLVGTRGGVVVAPTLTQIGPLFLD